MGLRRSAPISVMSVALLVGCASEQKKDARVIRDVQISGNDEISSRDIKEKIVTSKTGWWPFAHKQYFDPVTWQSDLKRIERLYVANGFYQAEVTKDEGRPDGSGRVDLAVHVSEGKPTHISKLDVQGLDSLPPADLVGVLQKLPVAAGDVFREEDWESAKRLLADRMRNHGYAKASV